MAAGSHMTLEIWSLTLEIIRLLNGETYPDTQTSNHVTITVSPPPSLTPDRHTLQKILVVTRKITELLIGEMESPLELCLEVKAENEDEPFTGEAGYSGNGRDLWSDLKIKPSGVTLVRSSLWEYGDGSAAEEAGATSEEAFKEEENSHLIGADGRSSQATTEELSTILSHSKKEKDDIILPNTPFSYPALPPADLSSPCTHSTYHTVFTPLSPVQSFKKSYSCSHCGKCFSRNSDLIKHERVHTGEKPYSCLKCGKCFADKSNLITHERVHTGEKSYPCSECKKCFSQKSYLLKHQRVHTGDKPYSCFECGRCFSRKEILIIHERTHTGEKPYSCSECGKCFLDKSSLIKHGKVHSGEKPFSCTLCGKCFSHKSNLISHEKLHTGEKPFLCSDCGKCFSQKEILITHKRTHTGERPFACSVCGKCFSQKSNLTKHERVHTGERPYSCTKCGKCFSQKGHLITHERVHAGEKSYSCT